VDVERDLAELGGRLLVAVVDQMAEGTAREEPQDVSRATYAPKITREDGRIDWSRPAAAIHNQVRGLYPWPHAYTYLDGARLIVLGSEPMTRLDSGVLTPGQIPGQIPDLTPGTIVEVTRDTLHVATGDGHLALLRVQPEGKRPMPVRDFLAGRDVEPGTRLT